MTVQASDRRVLLGALVAGLGCAIALAGVLLPWVAGSNGARTQIGLEYSASQLPINDGGTYLILALLTVGASVVYFRKDLLSEKWSSGIHRTIGSGAGLGAMSGLMIASISVLLLPDISRVVDAANSVSPGSAAVGLGIYVDIVGGLVMIAGSGLRLLYDRDI